jgi:hypothetical protein
VLLTVLNFPILERIIETTESVRTLLHLISNFYSQTITITITFSSTKKQLHSVPRSNMGTAHARAIPESWLRRHVLDQIYSRYLFRE